MGSIPATEAHITALADLMSEVEDCSEYLVNLPRYISGWREVEEGIVVKQINLDDGCFVKVTVDLNETTLTIESL